MVYRQYLFVFTLTCTRAFGCSDESCLPEISYEGEALSLLQTNARALLGAGLSSNSSDNHTSLVEVAYVNFIRHGEKCNASGEYLMPMGFKRAKYLGRCMSSPDPSEAMPFGAATDILVGSGVGSIRPLLTAEPLGEALNIEIHTPCSNPVGVKCLVDHMPALLKNRGTLIVIDIYQMLPYLFKRMNVPDVPSASVEKWPTACPSSTKSYIEPSCCGKDINVWQFPDDMERLPYVPVSVCFDQIWQIKMTRTRSHSESFFHSVPAFTEWKAQSFKRLAEGFGGSASDPCLQDLKPIK